MVFTGIAIDPVQRGWVESYAHPGGRLTRNVQNALGGEDTIAEKRFALFKELVPSTKRLGMLGPATIEGVSGNLYGKEISAASRAGERLGFEAQAHRMQTIDDLGSAIDACVRDNVDAIYLSGETLLVNNISRLLPRVFQTGKPTLGTYVEWARAGVLMTYGADILDGYRRAGLYVAKVLQGANPGELPIEQPSKFIFAVNATTAKQLGVAIPASIEASTDEVID